MNLILLLVLLGLHRQEPQDLDLARTWVLIAAAAVISALLEAWLVYKVQKGDKEPVPLVVAGLAGSLTNTILVLGMIGLRRYAPWAVIFPIAVFNGLPEAIVVAVITLAVLAAWKRIETGRKGSTV